MVRRSDHAETEGIEVMTTSILDAAYGEPRRSALIRRGDRRLQQHMEPGPVTRTIWPEMSSAWSE